MLRGEGWSIPAIAIKINVGWATVFRYLDDQPKPETTHGRDGKTYHRVAQVHSVRINRRTFVQDLFRMGVFRVHLNLHVDEDRQ